MPPIVYAVKLVLKQPLTVNGYDYLKKLRSTINVDNTLDNIEINNDVKQIDSLNKPNASDNQDCSGIEREVNKPSNEENSSKIDTNPICLPDSAVGAVPDRKING